MHSKTDETWDPAWGAGNSAFQTAAKDLPAHEAKPFAALRAGLLQGREEAGF